MPTIFSKIIAGDIPVHKVAESNEFLAFLDINPLSRGHALVIPKEETDYLFDIADAEYVSLWVFAKILAQGIKLAFPCEKVGVAVIGLEVAHAHIHLVPLNEVNDLNFSREKLRLTDEELASDALRIREALASVTRGQD